MSDNKIYYSIEDMSKMFNVSKDTIRHYEKLNLIKPKRSENNYRIYGNEEIAKLNTVCYLKELNVPLKCIYFFLNNQTVENSVEILKKNQKKLYMEVKKNSDTLKAVNLYLSYLNKIKNSEILLNSVIIKSKKDRYFYKNSDSYVSNLDFFVKINDLYSENLTSEDLKYVLYIGGIFNYEFKNVICEGQFLLSPFNRKTKHKLSEGYYASYFFKGKKLELATIIEIMICKIKKNGYVIKPPFYVFYLLNYYETDNSKEYLTEIQIKIEKT